MGEVVPPIPEGVEIDENGGVVSWQNMANDSVYGPAVQPDPAKRPRVGEVVPPILRACRKNDREWLFPCSCDECARAAAATWRGYMDRVMNGTLKLTEAQTLMEHQQ